MSIAMNVRVSGASVYLNEVLVVTLRSGRNEERAANVGASLKKLTPDADLRIEKQGTSYAIVDGDRTVLTAGRLEAAAQDTTTLELAKAWLANLKKALNTSPQQFGVDSVKIPLGKTQILELAGTQLSEAEVLTDNSAVAAPRRKGTRVSIYGKAVGDATITLTSGEFTKSVKVKVMPYAAVLPQTFTVRVTGDPASNEVVRGAVEGALWTRFQSVEGTESQFKMPDPGTVGREESKTIRIPVKVSGNDVFTSEGVINVIVKNEALFNKPEQFLWYCNEPENITRFQNLFASELKPGIPVRLLYHHINASYSGMVVEAQVINESDVEAQVLILPGDSKPDKNPVLAGIVAGDQLLRNWIRFSGEVVTVPPRSSIPIAIHRLAPQETMSGLASLRLLDGGPSRLVFRVDSMPPLESGGTKLDAALNSSTPWRRLPPQPLTYEGRTKVTPSPHIYPKPFKTETVDYVVGGRHGFVRIGQKPISRPEGKGLDGNFGVFYTIEASLSNPLNDSADIEIVFEASAGYSGALFIVNGELKRTPLLQPKDEALIMRVKLSSGEKRKLTIMTVPLSGSSYPATIVVRPVGTGSVRVH